MEAPKYPIKVQLAEYVQRVNAGELRDAVIAEIITREGWGNHGIHSRTFKMRTASEDKKAGRPTNGTGQSVKAPYVARGKARRNAERVEDIDAELPGADGTEDMITAANRLIRQALTGSQVVSKDRLAAAVQIKKMLGGDDDGKDNPFAGVGAEELAERTLQTCIALVGVEVLRAKFRELVRDGLAEVVAPKRWEPDEMAAWRAKGGQDLELGEQAEAGQPFLEDGGAVAGGGAPHGQAEPVLHDEVRLGEGEPEAGEALGLESESYPVEPSALVGVEDEG